MAGNGGNNTKPPSRDKTKKMNGESTTPRVKRTRKKAPKKGK